MKEINFLPQWYKQNKINKLKYRMEFIALSAMFLFMLLWIAVAGYRVLSQKNKLSALLEKSIIAEQASGEYAVLKRQLHQLQKNQKIIESIDSRMDITHVLAELSYLIDSKTVVTKLEFDAESLSKENAEEQKDFSRLRVAEAESYEDSFDVTGNIRFKIMIKGIAFAQGDVAEFVCKLEDSPYFCKVIPSYTRNVKAKTGTLFCAEGYQISEFELSCYLANCLVSDKVVVKKNVHRRKL